MAVDYRASEAKSLRFQWGDEGGSPESRAVDNRKTNSPRTRAGNDTHVRRDQDADADKNGARNCIRRVSLRRARAINEIRRIRDDEIARWIVPANFSIDIAASLSRVTLGSSNDKTLQQRTKSENRSLLGKGTSARPSSPRSAVEDIGVRVAKIRASP